MTDTLGTALLATQQTIKNPHLDSTNPHFGSKFASLGAHLDAIVPVANTNGLVVVQEPSNINGTPALTTRVIHAGTFEFIESVMPLAVDKPGPQGQGSALTYARRYALASIFGVVGEPDDDGQAAQGSPGQGGTRQVERREAPLSPPAAPSFVEQAKAAQQEHRPARPDIPTPTDRTTPKGDTIMQAVTHVKQRPDRTTKDGLKPVFVFTVVLDGEAVEMTTMSERTRDAAVALLDTTCRVEFVVNGRFHNLWGVYPVESEAMAAAAGALTDADIPF